MSEDPAAASDRPGDRETDHGGDQGADREADQGTDREADQGTDREAGQGADGGAGDHAETDETTPVDPETSTSEIPADGTDTTDPAADPTDERDAPSDETADAHETADAEEPSGPTDDASDVPPDVRKYERFKKMDGAQYERVNEFLRDRTYITAREWAIARLCADFRTETGVEMTKIGENLPELVPFMTDTYTPQAVNQARHSFEEKVTKAGATFLYGAMCGFFTAEDLDEMMYEVTEIAKFLMEVEGVDLAVEDELETEDRISSVMREVREESQRLRGTEVACPECGHVHQPDPEE